MSGALYSTKKKSSRSPTHTVSRRLPENPPIRFTPNSEEIASLPRKARRMSGPGSAVMRFQASSGVIGIGSSIDLLS
ncbi:hypothetical protein SAMN04244572_04877 [Azotobacter beijerinckii]|uniref:Uncharacterized protein n=1 Tax=Azotobacter beijerinckii TaxID=170623 RepID=A0A1H6ZEW8_9GAMM|nr:hypothetical protein SAMN04244579_04624 [Azotobacter beijerinckii]SEJ67621.1 hypothetical protein SAMN04244572_04877 [Azotobacter beijerinckii]